MATSHPSRASARAMARPSLWAPPVTRAARAGWAASARRSARLAAVWAALSSLPWSPARGEDGGGTVMAGDGLGKCWHRTLGPCSVSGRPGTIGAHAPPATARAARHTSVPGRHPPGPAGARSDGAGAQPRTPAAHRRAHHAGWGLAGIRPVHADGAV